MHGEDDEPDATAPDLGAHRWTIDPPGPIPGTRVARTADEEDEPAPGARDRSGATGRLRRVGRLVRELNEHERLLLAVAHLRRRLPGDDRFGDALSTSDQARDPDLAIRVARLAGQTTGGAVHELGMGALQLWQAAAERQGRGRGTQDLTVVFTDLVGFSGWALEAGDQATLLLLREVAGVLDPAVAEHRGTVVKWLGDGMMAVFRDPMDALRAVERAREGLDGIEVAGHAPHIRAGMHLGRPRRVGGDYLGVDVNIAARVAQAAATDELLASGATVEAMDPDLVVAKRRRRFRAKGVPPELEVHAVRSA